MLTDDAYAYGNPFLTIASLDAALAADADDPISLGAHRLTDPSPSPEATTHFAAVAAAIDRFLGQLSPRARQVFELVFWDDLSQAEVAKRLGISSARVSQIVSKTLDLARTSLAGHRESLTFH